MIRSISVSRPDDGVELAVGGELGQVAAELVEQLRGLLALALPDRRPPAPAPLPWPPWRRPPGPGQHADDLVADLLGVGVEVEQDAGGDALVLAHQAEQDVLGADVVVAEAQRLAQRELEHLLGARRERDLAGGDLLAGADDAHDLRAHALDGDVEALEDAGGEALLLAEQAEQDVLGADVVVLERPRLLLRENDHLAGSFCESLEHAAASFLLGRGLLAGRSWRGPDAAVDGTSKVARLVHPPIGPRSREDERSGSDRRAWVSLPQPGPEAPRARIGRASAACDAGVSPASRGTARPRGSSCGRVSTITRRSMPSPTPPVGGMPCSSACDEDLVVGLGLLVARRGAGAPAPRSARAARRGR